MIKKFKNGKWLALDLKANKMETFSTEAACDAFLETGIKEKPFTEENFDFGETFEQLD